MVTLNGKSYKLVYLDTNVINEISKNSNLTGKNFLEEFASGEYAFVTSSFNLYELSKAQGNSRTSIIRIFDNFPLAVCHTYPQLIEFEKEKSSDYNGMIMFAMGHPPLFYTQLSVMLDSMSSDNRWENSFRKMNSDFTHELEIWRRNQTSFNWLQHFNENLLLSMNETFAAAKNYFEIQEIGQYKSLETYAFVKNQFIYTTQKPIDFNSIIDAYNASVLPYVEVYISERTVSSWLNTLAKSRLPYLQEKRIIKLSDLYCK